MKTRNILTLLVLAVFAFSFSTAHSQEKKTKREIKKEQESEVLLNIFDQGDFYIFRAVRYVNKNDGFIRPRSGITYTTNRTTKRGVNLLKDFSIFGEPESVAYDVKGKYKCDVLYRYTAQGRNGDKTYLLAYTYGKNSVQVYEIVDYEDDVSVKQGNYPLEQIFSMDDYPENQVDLWSF